MLWKTTDKPCFKFSWYRWNNNVTRGYQYDEFEDYFPSWQFSGVYIAPKCDLSSIETNYKTKTINPGSTLFFDPGSKFPRFKLGLSDCKRCIKTPKANYIIVTGECNYSTADENFVVIEDNNVIYLIKEDEFKDNFGSNLQQLVNKTVKTWINPQIIFTGRLYTFNKENLWLLKYELGEYTLPYVTDVDLDKIICNMCPELTYEELTSIIDMLDSEDAAVVQLGMKTLTAYNVSKYKLTLRLILCSRSNWFLYSKNSVGTKQLMETLDLDRYCVRDDLVNGAYYIDRDEDTFEVEDVALAKRIGRDLLEKDLKAYLKRNYLDREYAWLPDERTVTLS